MKSESRPETTHSPAQIRQYAAELLAKRPDMTKDQLRAELETRFMPGGGVELPLAGVPGAGLVCRPPGMFGELRMAFGLVRWLFTRNKEHGHKAIAACISEVLDDLVIR